MLEIALWALGYVAEKALDRFFTPQFHAELSATVEGWAKELPETLWLYPPVFFATSGDEFGDTTARKFLGEQLAAGTIPPEELWTAALWERWNGVKSNVAEPQPFFAASREAVEPHLSNLAKRLWTVTATDRKRFQLTVLDALAALAVDVNGIRALLSQRKLENRAKVWRELSTAWLPLPNTDLNIASTVLASVIAPALYDTFGADAYKKFTTLFWFTFGEPSKAPGFIMHTAYPTLVANIRKQIVDSVRAAKGEAPHPHRQLLDEMKLYWNVTSLLPQPSSGLEAVEITYDGPQKRASYLPLPLAGGKLTVHEHMTTSDALRAYVIIARSNNFMLEVDFRQFHAAAVKLLASVNVTKQVALGPYRVNVNDPDEWDYDTPGIEEALIDA